MKWPCRDVRAMHFFSYNTNLVVQYQSSIKGEGMELGFGVPLAAVVLLCFIFSCEQQTIFGALMDTTKEGVGGDIERRDDDWGAGS